MERPICNNNSCSGSSRLLDRIHKVEFALVEINLFLDAYPNNAEALAYYHKLAHEREALVAEYQKHTPLTASGVTSTQGWTWISSPWPWHYDAN